MNLKKLLFTKNDCYKAGKTLKPTGIMVHSTGANNSTLRRYVGPDDGAVGSNKYGNHWNQARPDGEQKCPHAFIGKLADDSIATYQTLPWDMRGWHAGGKANNTHIGFEICEDALTDPEYFSLVYQEAVDLCAHLCTAYGIKPEKPTLICHSEGYKLGIASNHGDVMHWWPKFGANMDMFRTDVKKFLEGGKDVDTLIVYHGDGDLPAAALLQYYRPGAAMMSLESYNAGRPTAKELVKVGGAALTGAVLLSGSGRKETMSKVLEYIG